MADMKKLLHTFDEADEILNDKIERTNLSTIVASATASVENKKTVLIRGTGRNIEVLKVGGKTVQNGTPTPTAPVEVKGVGDSNIYVASETVKKDGYILNDTGVETTASTAGYTVNYTEILPSSTCTISGINSATTDVIRIYFFDSTKKWIGKTDLIYDGDEFTTPNNCHYIRIQYVKGKDTFDKAKIVIKGKYKIPILTDGKSQNIYLDTPLFDGEIADLVKGTKGKKWKSFTITSVDERYWKYETSPTRVYYDVTASGAPKIFDFDYNADCVVFSNYFIGQAPTVYGTDTKNGCVNFAPQAPGMVRFGVDLISSVRSVAAWKTWVEARAAEGNPLTIWYTVSDPSEESFEGSEIPVGIGEVELTLNTDVIPSSIETVTFGDYYSKTEVDKKFGVVYGKITSSTGTIDENSTYCVKSGNVVSFRVKVTGCTIDRNWGAVANLPFKPIKLTNVFNIEGSISSFWAQTDGTVSRYATISNSTLDISGIYITND